MADRIFPDDLTQKATPVGADIILLADSASSDESKYALLNTVSHTILADIGSNTHAQIDSFILTCVGDVVGPAKLEVAVSVASEFTSALSFMVMITRKATKIIITASIFIAIFFIYLFCARGGI